MAISQGTWCLETRERTQTLETNMLQVRCPPMVLLLPTAMFENTSRWQLYDEATSLSQVRESGNGRLCVVAQSC
jgi:hypothetical protein